jgi:hypothetical protein
MNGLTCADKPESLRSGLQEWDNEIAAKTERPRINLLIDIDFELNISISLF